MAVEDIDIDDESIVDSKSEKYKGRQGYTDRIGLILDEGIKFKKAMTHYGFNTHFLCKRGFCCEVAPKPSEPRIGCIVIHYRTDKHGGIEKPFAYELKPWIFSEKKYLQLRRVNEEWPLTEHDLKVTCQEQKYQQLEFTSCKEAFWRKSEKLKKDVLEQAKVMIAKLWFGKDLSNEELKELAGMEVEGVDGSDTSDEVSEDYSDILSTL